MLDRCLLILCLFTLFSCSDGPIHKDIGSIDLKTAPTLPPQWAKEVVWYQIMVERFHNGDPSNDPSVEDIQGAYPGYVPTTWQTTPWTQDWYKEDAYFTELDGKLDFNGKPILDFDTKTALRRYGGDLQGVLGKLDYLKNLGVNALYFNPINDAPSSHKFDARHWRHVDVNFGPDPIGDRKLIDDEDPSNPSTWVMTSADKLFLEVIKQVKARNMKIILDYSWKHPGHTFWAWQDLLKNQQDSEYANWYSIERFDDLQSPENEFVYKDGIDAFSLSKLHEADYIDQQKSDNLSDGDLKSQAAKEHILAVSLRWLDPNGDGDLSDGVDGYRLDVAEDLPLGFWRDYRQFVKSVNPEALLIGEVWRDRRPNETFNPAPFLQGDTFDAVMNYKWYKEARHYFAQAPNKIKPSQFVAQLTAQSTSQNQTINSDFNYSMMNMSASHDSPRLLTSLSNQNEYKHKAKNSQNNKYKSFKPSGKTIATAKLLLVHQYTYIGAPQIWAGDEMGMWGSDEPHNRKPLTWPEYQFESESNHPLAKQRQSEQVRFNQDLFDYYQFLVKLRRANSVLSSGNIEFSEVNDSEQLLSYRRFDDNGNQVFVAFNTGRVRRQLMIPDVLINTRQWQVWRSSQGLGVFTTAPSEQLSIAAESAMVIIAR